MTHQLIIRFHANQLMDWLQINDQKIIIAGEYQQTSLNIPPLADAAAITLIIPTTDISSFTIKIPKMKHSQLARALPYAVEEYLCEDIHQLHMVAGQWQSDQETLPIFVIARKKIEHYLALCAAEKITPQWMFPDVLLLPYQANQWTVAVENKLVLIRTDAQTGLAVDADNIAPFLNSLLTTERPRTIKLNTYDAEIPDFFRTLSSVQTVINPQTKPLLLNALNEIQQPINLLQGTYKTAQHRLHLPAAWTFSVQLAVAAFILTIMTLFADYFSLKKENAQLEQQITTLAKIVLPDKTIDASSQIQVEHQLRKLEKIGKSNTFLLSLDKLGKSLQKKSGITIKRIIYYDHLFKVQVSASHSTLIKDWLATLANTGIAPIKINWDSSDTNTAEITFKEIAL